MHGAPLSVALVASDLGRHLHHHLAGPKVDYAALALAAAVSWIGIPGAGEAALIAAGISAAHGHVDIVGVLAVAWAGAMAGGTAGWLIGLAGGRSLATRPGPLLGLRLRMLRHGDAVYARRGWLAVYLAPSWMAGISAMAARRFLPANAVASLVWALTIGLGSYYAGRSIADAITDVGTAGLVGAAVLLGGSLVVRRRGRTG
jgi:membrane protein DedA with SNARE-associated domain